MRRYGPEIDVSSEEPKAEETAEIVAGRLGIGCSVYPGLHKHDRTGVPFLDDEEFGRAARTFFEKPDELVWGGETARQAGSRFEDAVRKVLDERKEEVVTVVAHGTVISLLIARYKDLDAYALWRSLGLPSFCVLSAEDFQLRRIVPSLRA